MPPIPPLNLTGGAGGPSGATQAGATSGMFSADGWNVNFGGTQTNSLDKTGGQTGATVPGLTGVSGGGMSPVVWIAAAALIVGAILWKRKR